MQLLTLTQISPFQAHIEVNLTRPEENGPCKLFPFQNKRHNRFLHNGFDLTIEADLRDLVKDHFKAQLISNHEVLVQIPAYSATWLQDVSQYDKACEDQVVKQSHVVNRNAVARDQNRKNLLFLYIFSKEVQLANIFSDPADTDGFAEGIIFAQLHFWSADFIVASTSFKSWYSRVSWIFAVKESNPREAEVAQTKTSGLSQLEKQIAGMKLK
jgi:hypothetical protein